MEMEKFGSVVPLIVGTALMYFLMRNDRRPVKCDGDRRHLVSDP